MRRILQGDSTGCGLACIAMLADCSYKKVKKKAVQKLNFSNKRKLYTGTRHLKILGKCFGINIAGSRRRPFKNWDALPDTAIISINPNLNHTSWHWVVFSRTMVLHLYLILNNLLNQIKELILAECAHQGICQSDLINNSNQWNFNNVFK